MADKVHQVLSRRPEERSTADILCLFDWIMKNGSTQRVFNGVKDSIIKTICREMTLATYKQDRVVCKQGEYGDTFYIILSGQVSVWELTPSIADEAKKKRLDERNFTLEHEICTSERSDFGVPGHILHVGSTFGELAVLDPSCRRSRSILTDKPTSFICLRRAAYQRLTRTSNLNQCRVHLELLQHIYLFDAWTRQDLTQFASILRKLEIPPEGYVARHGNECNGMFFLLKGQVQESIPMTSFSDPDGSNARYFAVEDLANKRSLADRFEYYGKAQHQRNVQLELNLLQKFDFCGMYPLCFGRQNYHTDIRAITPVEALFVDKSSWNEVFRHSHSPIIHHTFNLMKQAAAVRESWRQTRINIATQHPDLMITISTKDAMKLVKIGCGCCGSDCHATGTVSCPTMLKIRASMPEKYTSITVDEYHYEDEKEAYHKEEKIKEAENRMMMRVQMKMEKLNLRVPKRVKETQERHPVSIVELPCSRELPSMSLYRKQIFSQLKKVETMQTYHENRDKVLKRIVGHSTIQKKKPKVPRTSRRHPNRQMCRKKRFERRIDKKMSRILPDPVPVREQSLLTLS